MKSVAIVGAGPMAVEYSKVLDAINVNYHVLGRGAESAERFESLTGKKVLLEGVDNFYSQHEIPEFAIICTGVENLKDVTEKIIINKTKNILIEKPGATSMGGIKDISCKAKEFNCNVYIAYNRRCYSSVIRAKEIMESDGGPLSMKFDFTEWEHVIEKYHKAPGVKDRWFISNSTHVVDLAFYLCGKPIEINCYTSGSLDWHPASSVFAGAGITEKGVLFSYHANWHSAGRWAVEILTKNNKIIFIPMEKLHVQKKGSLSVEPIEIDDEMDKKFKPGLYLQVESFLNGKTGELCTIDEQFSNISIYNKMANY